MKWRLGQDMTQRLWVCLLIAVMSSCQLVTGVNDLRVENEEDETSDKSDEEPDADRADDNDDSDPSDDSDNSRSDAAHADASNATQGSDESEDKSSEESDDPETTTDSEGTTSEGTIRSDAGSDSTEGPTSTSGSDAGCQIPGQLACAPITNCGCNEGTVCTVTPADDQLTVACVPPGDAELGDSCEPGACKSGLHCVQGICRQACVRDNDCEEEGASCSALDIDGEASSKVRFCEAPCDLIAPANPTGELHACPEGQTCVRTATSPVCTSSVGAGTLGSACEHDTDCAVGHGCIEQVCKPWCDPGASTCGDWAACNELADVVGATGSIGACEGTCEIAAAAGSTCGVLPDCGCAGGQSCRLVDATGRTECSVIGFGAEQTWCDYDYDCQTGLTCVGSLCRPFCDLAAPNCADSAGCFPFYFDEDDWVADVGICGGSCDAVWPANNDEPFTPCGSGAICEPGYVGADVAEPHCIGLPDVELVGYGETCDPETDWCNHGSVCTGTCELLCRSHDDCAGETPVPECLEPSGDFVDTDGAAFGLCCALGPIADSECSSFSAACGCADGEACRMARDEDGFVFTDGHTACSAAGDIGVQSPCALDTDCVRGASCVEGLCRQHCDGECAATEGACVQVTVGDETPVAIPDAFICLGLCDPRAPQASTEEWSGCGEGVKCLPGTPDDEFRPTSGCAASLDDRALGEDCLLQAECAAGLACICSDAECTIGSCQTWCVTDDDCAAGTCLEIEGQIKPGVPLGYCSE